MTKTRLFGLSLVLLIIVGSGICVSGAYSIGKTTLEGNVLEWDGQKISAKGKASFSTTEAKEPLKPSTMRLETIKADTITITLTRGRNNEQTLKEASATGGVIIQAKRSDVESTDDGSKTIIRTVTATAQTANMTQTQEIIKLTGNVKVKINEPGIAEPIAMLSGDVVTISLKDNSIRVEGQSGKPAELTVTQ